MPTTLSVHLPHRLPDEVEACAYFVVAEALTNITRHAGASTAAVTVRLDEAANQLHVTVFDDGRGGAWIVEDDSDRKPPACEASTNECAPRGARSR